MDSTITATSLVKALERHYRGGPGHRDQYAWAAWQELEAPAGRRIDYLALSLWGSRGRQLIGHEIKVSRSDWLSELAQPSKAEEWWQACNRWYLVVPDEKLVEPGELPPGWGLMVPPPASKRSMRVVVEPPLRQVAVPHWLTTAMVKRDRLSHARQMEDAVRDARYAAHQKGYEEGKKALEDRTGRFITRAEEEQLRVMKRIEQHLGVSVEQYDFVRKEGAVIEPATAALALQLAQALQTATNPTYTRLSDFLKRIGTFAKSADDLRRAHVELEKLLTGGRAA